MNNKVTTEKAVVAVDIDTSYYYFFFFRDDTRNVVHNPYIVVADNAQRNAVEIVSFSAPSSSTTL